MKRGLRPKNGGGFLFGMLHPDGTLVRYTCGGLTAEQVWAMVEDTLGGNS